MKHLKSLVLVAFLAFGMIANAQKTAYIDTDKLLSEMPEAKQIEKEIERLAKTHQADIDKMMKEYQAKMIKYEKESTTQTEETNKKRLAEMQEFGTRIQRAKQMAGVALQQKQQEKLLPLIEKVKKAIQDVANEKGIIYVFDTKVLIVYDKGENLYGAVKSKLGF